MGKIKFANPKNPHEGAINTTSRSRGWSRGLSPFFLGPVELYTHEGVLYTAENVENAWQYSKVYPQFGDETGPNEDYWVWAQHGWGKSRADRYPMGRGAKPLYSYWDGEILTYTEARKAIYAPLYSRAVEETEAFQKLKLLYEENDELWLWDFDVYDFEAEGMTYQDVINCETKKMGHAFVLAMMLENQRVWE